MTPRLPDRCPSGLTWPNEIALQSGLFMAGLVGSAALVMRSALTSCDALWRGVVGRGRG